ncbi:hypothetical protein F5B22DRAFT_599403 [Xylaria bambusicola]|uniref:uncharacterized protein n=1 Tax=Xylaria bambusicola TaxID=326684 RepID=UPI0020076EA4|nr:uncharacterized protein F5B22DRAFT_599403 [Xylaria bambusicola]KAI0518496.1 hypothetical protein F5B22DRAFT_599403 [Xylaria bambusicola]
MLGRAVVPGDAIVRDAMATRAVALDLIREAWRDHILVPEERSLGRKRKRDFTRSKGNKTGFTTCDAHDRLGLARLTFCSGLALPRPIGLLTRIYRLK